MARLNKEKELQLTLTLQQIAEKYGVDYGHIASLCEKLALKK